jgi:LPS-assembly lipoprotein
MSSSSRGPRSLAAFLLVAALAGCGFQPMHARPPAAGAETGESKIAARPAARAELAAIAVAPIADSSGQMLRNELTFLFAARGESVAPRYGLDVTLTETISRFAVQVTGIATRANLRLDAHYVLRDLTSGEILLRGHTHASGSFDLLADEFATLIAARDAREQAVDRLARLIDLRLGAHFGGRAPATAAGSG